MNEEKTARTPGRADYADRQEARKERLEVAADKARNKSEESFEASRAETRHIPMGQPILIGHHSERRHRKALERSDNKMRASVQYSERANVLESRAAGVGQGGISADDPEAIQKIKAKIERLTIQRDFNKKINRVIRKFFNKLEGAELVKAVAEALDATESQAAKWLSPDYMGRRGIPSYEVTSDTTEIRRLNDRLKEIQQELEAGAFEVITGTIEGVHWKAYADEDENRICIEFESKISKELFKWMRGNGYNFSRTHGRFQRQLNIGGRRTTQYVAKQLKEKAGAEHV